MEMVKKMLVVLGALIAVVLIFAFSRYVLRVDPPLEPFETEYFSVLMPTDSVEYTKELVNTDTNEIWRIETPSSRVYSVMVVTYYPQNVNYAVMSKGLADVVIQDSRDTRLVERPIRSIAGRYSNLYTDSFVIVDTDGYESSVLLITDPEKSRTYQFAFGSFDAETRAAEKQAFFDSIVLK